MTRTAATVLAVALFATACSSSSSGGDPATTNSAVESTDTTAQDSTTSSIADSTTTAVADTSPTTSEPAPEDLVLHGDGIGSLVLGDEAGMVVEALTDQLDFPATDFTVEYTSEIGIGEYQNADGDTGFVAPFGRSVCWDFGFCAEFGGGSMAAMSFTGWTYRDDTAATLASPSGTSVGSRWADIPSMSVEPGGCYTVGGGTVDGIRLTLTSTGTPFSEFDASGNYVAHLPEPENVTVTWMETGEVPIFLYGDC